MELIWLKTKELQSYKVDFSWQSIMGPLVIGSTFCHRKDLFLSRLPLIIRSTSYHRRDLLSLKDLFFSRVQSIMGPLIIRSTSYHPEYLLSSKRPLSIGETSYHRRDLFSQHLLLAIVIFVRPGAS